MNKQKTNTYKFNEDFDNISVNVDIATVTFVPSDDGICKIECIKEKNLTHSAKIQDGTLMISAVNNRRWYDYICINFQAPTVIIYLPKDVYKSLSVTTVTGNIEIPDRYTFETVTIKGTTSNISCYAHVLTSIEVNTTIGNITLGSVETKTVNLSATIGKITAYDVACDNLTAKSSTGHIKLNNVITKESMKVGNTTGGVKFEDCDAFNITVSTITGNIKGTLLSEKIFITKTDTGRISVPKTSNGGNCEITTNTGNIKIEIV